MNWPAIAPDFDWDGSLRDLRVENASITDWEHVWSFHSTAGVNCAFAVDGIQAARPATVQEIFALRENHSVLASFLIDGITYNCHFFSMDDVEFDLDPREVDGAEAAQNLAQFMETLCRLTDKPVRLTPENLPQVFIARVEPSNSEVEWLHVGG